MIGVGFAGAAGSYAVPSRANGDNRCAVTTFDVYGERPFPPEKGH
jgi:hypothetical protein